MEIYEIEKKTASWSDSTNNYEIRKSATPENGAEFRELTVTITLSEYRELVKNAATRDRDIEKANLRWREAEKKCEEQAAEIEALRAALRTNGAEKVEG